MSKSKTLKKKYITRGILMSSQIDELLIMPINKKKDKEKDYLKSCIHSECIFIMIQILIETVKFEKGKTITLILIHLSDSC